MPKQGKTLVEMAQTLQSIRKNSRDYVVPVEMLKAYVTPGKKVGLSFEKTGVQSFDLNNHSFGQLVGYSNVPKQYADRLKDENPRLLENNLNHGLDKLSERIRKDGKPESRMIRTIGQDCRAFLSSSYKRIDSYDLLNATLPILIKEGFNPISSEITDRRMYLRCSTGKLQGEIKKGDVVEFGISISNSDVGAGTAQVNPYIRRLVCDNGLELDYGFKKFHIGRNQSGNDFYELLSEKTKDLTEQTFMAQIRDVLNYCVRPEVFAREVEKLKEASERKITNFDLPQVIELSTKLVGVTGEKTKKSMLEYLAQGADGAGLNQWGLVNAFTFAAQQDHVNFDESVELERAGNKILTLNASQWQRVAVAA